MTLAGALRSSTLNALAALRRASINLPEHDPYDVADHLKRGPIIAARFDYATALELLTVLSIRLKDLPEDRLECYRSVIYLIVQESRPQWLIYARAGVSSIREHAPTSVRQCLRDVGLFEENVTTPTRLWWDKIRGVAYDELQRAQIENGTAAELLCIEHERKVLAALGRRDLEPKAVSVSSNRDGYDVLSFRIAGGKVVERQIEVKGFAGSMQSFHLSPNEWSAAQKFGDSYRLQVWSLDLEELICELTAAELSEHIARNRGRGKWDDLIIALGGSVELDGSHIKGL